MRRWFASGMMVVVALHGTLAGADTPAQGLDQHWVDVCAGAVPGTPFYDRCQEILNAGPGSGNRRSAAATGNNLEVVAAPTRTGEKKKEDRLLAVQVGRNSFFLSGNGGWESRPTTPFEDGFEAVSQTVVGGMDHLVSNSAVAGLGLSWTRYGTDFKGNVGDLTTQRFTLTHFWDLSLTKALALESHVGYNWARHDLTRTIDYLITLNAGQPNEQVRRVSGNATAVVRDLQIAAGGDVSWEGGVRSLRMLPHMGLEFIHTKVKPYSETDATGLGLSYEEQTTSSLMLLTGLSTSLAISREWGVLSPQVRADYVHEFQNDERAIYAHFSGDPGAFRLGIQTDAPDRDYVLMGGGVLATLPGGFSVYVNFQGTLGNDQMRNQLLTTGLRARL